jgi:hypothetical protein
VIVYAVLTLSSTLILSIQRTSGGTSGLNCPFSFLPTPTLTLLFLLFMLSQTAAPPSPSSPMLSTIPPPRPVSVNSLTRDPFPTPLAYQKSTRCASAQVPILDSPDDDAQAHSDPGDGHFGKDTVMEDPHSPLVDDASFYNHRPELHFENLPMEIHEAILDYLFGERTSTANVSPGKPSSRNRVKALHHPRRKALSNMALISPVWRPLVQDRIYRHSRLLFVPFPFVKA